MAYDPNNPNSPWQDSWTSSNGLTTTGTQNPFGLKTNNGAVIDPYNNTNAPQLANTIADNSANEQAAASKPPGFMPLVNSTGPANNAWSSTNAPGPLNSLINDRTPAANQTSTPNPYIAPQQQQPIQASYTQDLRGNQVWSPQSQPQQNSGSNPFSFLQGGLVADPLFPNGQAVNSSQYATPQSAQQIAQLLGGSISGANITGPGGAFTNDQQEISFPNGFKVNAGLVASLINSQGLEAAKKAIQNDMAKFGQAPSIDPHNLQAQPSLPTAPNSSGGNQNQDFMSQIMGLLALLQKLGIGTQRPPTMPASNSNGNFFSKFA